MTDRLEALREKMREEGVDFVALGPGAHLRWLLGVRPHADERPLLACVTAKDAGFLMPALEAESARTQTDLPFYSWADDQGPKAAFQSLLTTFGADSAKSIVLDECMRADFAALVQDSLPAAKRAFTESTVGSLRASKDRAEFDALKANALIADTAMQTAWAAMEPGLSELEVAAIVRESFSRQGARPLFTIVGTASNGAFPHHQTGETILKEGDAVVMDVGAGRDGYSSDITRMAIMGDKPDGYDEIHQIVENAVQAAMEAARPGAPASQVDQAARDVITKAGYGDYFVHRTGHGMGVEVHEPPYITASSQTVL
ncbi:MAG: aminopeptidase P family protein, partial [Pseudomonadota bacterium]